MSISFHHVPPKMAYALSDEALGFLDKAARKTPAGELTTEDILEEVADGKGLLHLIADESRCYGVSYVVFGQNPHGRVMNIVMLGGVKLSLWRNPYRDFMIALAEAQKCSRIWVMGRTGFNKAFPVLKPIGTMYELEVNSR